MNIDGKPFRTIWPNEDRKSVSILDQTLFPHEFTTATLSTTDDAEKAISDMLVRGAPLIGATAAYGMALACLDDSSDEHIEAAAMQLKAARPTAINLRWAVDKVRAELLSVDVARRAAAAWELAAKICDEDVECNSRIGDFGLELIEEIAKQKTDSSPVNILTHCNAGWLATVDYGTATAPIYKAYDKGIPVHVYVDETRPRNQGAHLTAWELGKHGVPHTLIVDNAGGHLMQHGQIDVVIVGSDRTTSHGDVCNKIGTYLKALAARDNDIPFYVTLPISTIDFEVTDGVSEIPIEERAGTEVTVISGITEAGNVEQVRITPENCVAANPAFDVTPRRLVTGLITERGIVDASPEGIDAIKPDELDQ
ncbi:MAG: S-methyl-5-thioribose-1-phosphate isomerase [Woeseiaceae bacterium]